MVEYKTNSITLFRLPSLGHLNMKSSLKKKPTQHSQSESGGGEDSRHFPKSLQWAKATTKNQTPQCGKSFL